MYMVFIFVFFFRYVQCLDSLGRVEVVMGCSGGGYYDMGVGCCGVEVYGGVLL
jgi:hypothetical protein